MFQAGIRAAAGTLLGAGLIAGFLALFLPIETMGRSLPEDTREIQELAILERENTGGEKGNGFESRNGNAEEHIVPDVEPGPSDQKNPFHVSQLDTPPSLDQQAPEDSAQENPFHVSQLDTAAEPAPAEDRNS